MANDTPARRRIIVDGSNIATEGRTLPSLAQLDEAIRAFLEEFGGFSSSDVTVVVDASFGHRIDESERAAFEEAVLHGEMLTPPAGAVGRGDGFILRIAEKSGALVLSNDSFQEFHAERPWLFDDGRLIGGKPVPGVGWIFTPRTPVRGPRSRSVTGTARRGAEMAEAADLSEAVADPGAAAPMTGSARGRRATGAAGMAKEARPTKATEATKAEKAEKPVKAEKAAKAVKATKAVKAEKPVKAEKASKAEKAVKATKATKAEKPVKATKATKALKAVKPARPTKATKTTEGTAPDLANEPGELAAAGSRRVAGTSKRASTPRPSGQAEGPSATPLPVMNEALPFITFLAEHPIGSTFEGTVVSFTSHGAQVDVGTMRCHIPLAGLGNPPPSKARDVLTKGEIREFVLVSLDAARRRASLALPGVGS
ncbi:MAG: NYN domain-containing protein [Acidimicrobiales bacterium]